MNAPEKFLAKSSEEVLSAATLVRVKIGKWSPYVFDKDATQKAYGSTKAGRANKHLCKESDRVQRCCNAFAAIGTYHNNHSGAWLDNGFRIVSNINLVEHLRDLGRLHEEAKAAREDLRNHWQEEIEKDRKRFERMAQVSGEPSVFDPMDYPPDVASRFYCEIRPMPMPMGSHLAQEIANEYRDDVSKLLDEAVANADEKAAEALAEPVMALVNRLTEYAGEKGQKFHKSLLDNVLDVAQRFRRMNVTGNHLLAQVAKDLENMAQSVVFDHEVLKGSQEARTSCESKLSKIMAKMEAMYGKAN